MVAPMTAAEAAPPRLTVEAFEAYASQADAEGRLLELIDGEMREKMPTEEHADIATNLSSLLKAYVRQMSLPARVLSEAHYRRAEDPHNARVPDVSLRLTREARNQRGMIVGYPDLAIEIQSPSQSIREMRQTARFYLANGVRLVWLVFPELRLIETYSADDEGILRESDTLTGGALLPEFSVAVSEVFYDSAAPTESAPQQPNPAE